MGKNNNEYFLAPFKLWVPSKSILKDRNLKPEVNTRFSQPFSFITVHSHQAVQGTGVALCWLQVLSSQNTSLWFWDWNKTEKAVAVTLIFLSQGIQTKKQALSILETV